MRERVGPWPFYVVLALILAFSVLLRFVADIIAGDRKTSTIAIQGDGHACTFEIACGSKESSEPHGDCAFKPGESVTIKLLRTECDTPPTIHSVDGVWGK